MGRGVEIEKLLSLKYINARFGRLPKDSLEKLSAYENNPYVDFTICTEDKSYYWGVYFTPVEKAIEIDQIFSGLYFEKSDILGVNTTPQQYLDKLNQTIPKLEEKLKETDNKLEDYLNKQSEMISKYISKLEEENLYSAIREKTLQYNDSFVIVGWIPDEEKDKLKKKLEKIESVNVGFNDAKNEIKKSPPVKLKNCFFAKPFEYYVEMYGVPKYNELDPSLFVAITYVLIFGIMFADVGQGICLSLVGMLMWKLKKMPIGKILFPCGISSACFGLLFGSVFGFEHLLDPMYKSLFGLEEKPIEVMSSDSIIMILLSAVAIGVILVIVAMILNVYSSFKQKDIGKALFSSSGLAGIVFYSSIIFGVVGQLFLGMSIFTLPYIIGLIVIPYLLIFFGEPLGNLISGEKYWQPESWGGYIGEHLIESIEFLLEYVTNTVSFLRVGAFVLVHAGMMLVVFVLAETAGPVAYWPVIVFGNAFVMVLEALLVSIQVLRLEYYEMFNRFYSGEGRPYEPVKLDIE
jgi:V/A-type H+-transporting ATPase subunit I